MITNFKIYENQIFEKSILTKLGVPDELMKELQKSFQFKYEMPEKIETPTKAKIKEVLNDHVMVLMISKQTDTYIIIYRDGWMPGMNYAKYTTYHYNGEGRKTWTNSDGISKTMKDVITGGFDVYTIKHTEFKKFRPSHNLSVQRDKKIKEQKIKDFIDYFNENMISIMNKINAKRWSELVQAIQTYYLNITKSIDIFVNRHGELPRSTSDRDLKQTSDFRDMAYTLQSFADKINDEGSYRLKRGTGWQDNGIIGREYHKDIKNFLKRREDFKLNKEEDNEDMLVRAIDQYGNMKLSTLFGRFIMTTMIDWIRKKIDKYTGMDKEMDKYNL